MKKLIKAQKKALNLTGNSFTRITGMVPVQSPVMKAMALEMPITAMVGFGIMDAETLKGLLDKLKG